MTISLCCWFRRNLKNIHTSAFLRCSLVVCGIIYIISSKSFAAVCFMREVLKTLSTLLPAEVIKASQSEVLLSNLIKLYQIVIKYLSSKRLVSGSAKHVSSRE